MEICSVDGCQGTVSARSWCSKHYTRWQRHGDPVYTNRTPPIKATDTSKFCPRCGNKKPLTEFGLRSGGRPKGYCKPCENKYQSDYAKTQEGREKLRRSKSKWNDGNHEYFINYRYGLSGADYAAMVDSQGGRCAICGTDKPNSRNTVWSVDHCHNSNRVRGLLCSSCNTGLGYFKDDPVRLAAAVAYLAKFDGS